MLTEDRQKKIMSLLARRGSVTVSELMKSLNASESTIRRDLNAMDGAGMLTKVHGGAVPRRGSYAATDDEVELRRSRNAGQKQAIAQYAATLIEDNEFVYLDAGTTTELMIDYIKCSGTSFVTNSLTHAKKLTERGFTTYIPGGEFKSTTEAIVGEEAVRNIMKYNFSKCFVGTNGIDGKRGYTTPEPKEGLIKQTAVERSAQCYVLADHSKFGQTAPVTFAAYEDAIIITDSGIDEMTIDGKSLKKSMPGGGVNIIVAQQGA